MEIQTLEQMLDQVERMVHDQMHETGQILPFLLCQKQDGEIMFIGYNTQPTAIQRRVHALKIGNRLRELGVATYVVAHEVWMKEFVENEPLTPPSKSSDRSEAVMIQAHNLTAIQTRIFSIDRQDREPKLTPMEDKVDGVEPGGTWDNLLMDPNAV